MKRWYWMIAAVASGAVLVLPASAMAARGDGGRGGPSARVSGSAAHGRRQKPR